METTEFEESSKSIQPEVTTILLNKMHPAITALSQADSKLASLIELIGDLTLRPSYKPFESLVLSIISQQLCKSGSND